jgi:hypothetical protein
MTLDDMVSLAEDQARRVLIGTKEKLMPQWLLASLDRTTIYATPWGGNDEKHLVIAAMGHLMRAEQVHAYSLLVEAWFAVEKLAPGEKAPERAADYKGPPVSERPDRRECVVITAENRYGEHRNAHLEIIRDKKGRCAELKRFDGPEDRITGIFDGLLGEKVKRQ